MAFASNSVSKKSALDAAGGLLLWPATTMYHRDKTREDRNERMLNSDLCLRGLISRVTKKVTEIVTSDVHGHKINCCRMLHMCGVN
jgi:hypothetical protein